MEFQTRIKKISNMKVKIGDKIVDANDEPIMLIFENDSEVSMVGCQIINMHPDSKKYCMFPDGMDQNIIQDFMKTN